MMGSNARKKAARELAAAEQITYTQALRRIGQRAAGTPQAGQDGITATGAGRVSTRITAPVAISADTASSIGDAVTAMAQLTPVCATRMSIDPHNSTDGTIRVMAELSPDPPQETQWWWSEQIVRRVPGLAAWTGPSRFTVHLDVPRDQLEATARALRAAVDQADAAFASGYAADVHARHQIARERQEQQRRRAADAQAVLDQVISQ